MEWTIDKIAALAANAAAEKRGRETARAALWTDIGTDGLYIWGHCKGSGTMPYQTQINLDLPAFACTCPLFAKPPCKHALGLLYYWEGAKASFPKPDAAPEWVEKWRAKHQSKPKEEKIISPEQKAEQERARAQRRQKRLEAMASGMEELERWLLDLAAQGAANADVLQGDFWEAAAKRMSDAQLPRVAAFLRETAALLADAQDWLACLMRRVGELYLLVRAFEREKAEAANFMSGDDLLTALGVNAQKKDVLAENAPVEADWLVAGIEEGVDLEGIAFRKVWLYQLGAKSPQKALLLDFAFGQSGYEQIFVWGTRLRGALTYFPSATPQRALLPSFAMSNMEDLKPSDFQPYTDVAVMLADYARDLTLNLSLLEQLTALAEVWVHIENPQQAYLVDKRGQRIALIFADILHAYRLVAIGGGEAICVVGKLTSSRAFQALSVLCDGQIVPVAALQYSKNI